MLTLYIENSVSRWIERCRKLLRIKIARNSYRGAIKRCPQQKGLDGLRSYQESIGQTASCSMDREAIKTNSRKLDGLKLRFHREKKKEGLDKCKFVEKLSSLKKMSFSKRGKTHRDECNMQATQT